MQKKDQSQKLYNTEKKGADRTVWSFHTLRDARPESKRENQRDSLVHPVSGGTPRAHLAGGLTLALLNHAGTRERARKLKQSTRKKWLKVTAVGNLGE